MARYQYKAYTAQGAIADGMIAAEGLDLAIDALYAAGLTPFETRLIAERDGERVDPRPALAPERRGGGSLLKNELFASHRFSLKELTSFTSELASLVNSGLTLDAAFRIIAGPGAGAKIARLAGLLLKDVLGGLQLSEAMARRPDIFPTDYCAILAAGEAGGATGQVLIQIAELLQRRLEIRNKITTALIYPAVLLVMSVVSVVVIAFVLIPNITPIFADAGLPLPGILGTLVSLQDNWPSAAVTLGIVALLGAALWRWTKGQPHILKLIDQARCMIPLVGRLVVIQEAGRFSRALGTLLAARVPLMAAMQTSRSLVTNRHLSEAYGRAVNRVPEGTPLHRAFEDAKLLPPASLRMVAVGEESGRLGAMLLQVAGILEADLQRTIERMVGLLTPMLTLLVGGCIGGLIMHVMSAVLSINDLAFQ